MLSGDFQFYFGRPKAVLRMTGEDVFTFLQGQFTNQLQQPSGHAVYGLWLNQKGKVLADSMVMRLNEAEFLVVSECSPAAVIRERLEAYIIADDVLIADETEAWAMTVSLGAEDALPLLRGAALADGKFLDGDGVQVWKGRLPREVVWLGAEGKLRALTSQWVSGGAAEITWTERERWRLAAGIPAVPVDIGGGDLPNEGGLEEVAISYTKGCYLGQEVMARLKNLGQVRRKLHRVRGEGPPPVLGTAVFQGTERVGELRSVVGVDEGFMGLAMLSLVKLNVSRGLSLAPEAAPTVQLITP